MHKFSLIVVMLSYVFAVPRCAFAQDRACLDLPTHKLHELVVSICQRAPCEGTTDQEKVDWMTEHLPQTAAALPFYISSLRGVGGHITVEEAHPQ